jgi:hypothetical protein
MCQRRWHKKVQSDTQKLAHNGATALSFSTMRRMVGHRTIPSIIDEMQHSKKSASNDSAVRSAANRSRS